MSKTIADMTGNGNTETHFHLGGRVIYARQGAGGTTKLQFSLEDSEFPSSWSDVSDGTNNTELTDDGSVGAELPACKLRVNLSGYTSGTMRVVIGQTGGHDPRTAG